MDGVRCVGAECLLSRLRAAGDGRLLAQALVRRILPIYGQLAFGLHAVVCWWGIATLRCHILPGKHHIGLPLRASRAVRSTDTAWVVPA
jgi:hypothetical protein